MGVDDEGRGLCKAKIHSGRQCRNRAVEGDFCRLHARAVCPKWQRHGLRHQSEIYGRCDESPTRAHVGEDDPAVWAQFFALAFKEKEAGYVADLGK